MFKESCSRCSIWLRQPNKLKSYSKGWFGFENSRKRYLTEPLLHIFITHCPPSKGLVCFEVKLNIFVVVAKVKRLLSYVFFGEFKCSHKTNFIIFDFWNEFGIKSKVLNISKNTLLWSILILLSEPTLL